MNTISDHSVLFHYTFVVNDTQYYNIIYVLDYVFSNCSYIPIRMYPTECTRPPEVSYR